MNVREVAATGHAFAALREDGAVITWGDIMSGGSSNHLREELKDVRQLASSLHSFAALTADGRVVAWGEQNCREQLSQARKM